MKQIVYCKGVFFDAAGTLFRVRGTVGEIYRSVALGYGVDPPAQVLERGFRRAFRMAPPMAFPGAGPEEIASMEKTWWREVVRETFREVGGFPRFDDYFSQLFEVFRGPRGWELFPETLEVLGSLRDRGFVVGVISNFDSRLLDVSRALGLTPYLDSFTLSSRAGAAKPDPAIFLRALDCHGLSPREAVHVGDSPGDDVRGAVAAGLVPVLLDRDGRERGPEGICTISHLGDLLELLALSPAPSTGRDGVGGHTAEEGER